MSGIDLALLFIILVSALVSLVRGFLREFVSLATWVAAVGITVLFTSRFATLLPRDTVESLTARTAISAAVLFIGCLMIGSLVSWLISKIVTSRRASLFDHVLGVMFGLTRGVIIIALLVLAANLAPTLKQETWWNTSRLLPRFQSIANSIHVRLPPEIGQHFDFTKPPSS